MNAISPVNLQKKLWKITRESDSLNVLEFSKALNINPSLAGLLINRGIDTFDKAKNFFRPELNQLYDPFLMKDMDKAIGRLIQAQNNQEKVLIYGDYDVDGTTAVSMFYGFFSNYHSSLYYYIPDRYKEGYGVSTVGIDWAASHGVSLIITLDCGIKSFETTKYAKSKGIDCIICDHHEPSDVLPEAFAVLDPKRKDCTYPFKELSGCGVGFKLLHAYCLRKGINLSLLFEQIDLVTISIAADIVPIVDENRIIAFWGLKALNQLKKPGIKALSGISGFKKMLTITDVVFGLSPRINAAGRIGHADSAVKLLLSQSEEEATTWAEKLNTKNSLRKDFDATITAEALEMICNNNNKYSYTTVLFKEDWHKGVVGIVASRCIEHFYRPTIILCESEGKISGSARSVDGFDLYEALSECDDLLEQWGGHAHAAGLTIKRENLIPFQDRFESVVSRKILPNQLIPSIKVDALLQLDQITEKLYHVISQMAPFGPGNMQPIFLSHRLTDKGSARILKEKHLKMKLSMLGSNISFDAIGFGMAHFYDQIVASSSFDVCYQIDLNEFMGQKSIQLMIKDIHFEE